jgi:hypothetical protein
VGALEEFFATGPLPTLSEIVQWVIGQEDLPQQFDLVGQFGDPPLTLWRSSRIIVDVYTWMDGTTSIHEHAFRGAFAVLSGASIHAHYEFCERGRSSSRLRWGSLEPGQVELLRRGDVRAIDASSTIHALFHTERPTLSIVVRSYRDRDASIQYDYLVPGVAFDPRAVGDVRRKVEMMRVLHEVSPAEFVEHAAGFLRAASASSWFITLRECFDFMDWSQFEQLLHTTAHTVDKDVASVVRQAFAELHRVRNIVQRRACLKDPDHRFLLALLLGWSMHPEVSAACRRASHFSGVSLRLGQRATWGGSANAAEDAKTSVEAMASTVALQSVFMEILLIVFESGRAKRCVRRSRRCTRVLCFMYSSAPVWI